MTHESRKRKKYARPAVKEAIFEAKFNYNQDEYDIALPGQIFEQIKDVYPLKKNIKHQTIVLGTTVNVPEFQKPFQAPLMQACKNDQSELVQVGPGIILANRLKYSTWEDFTPGIKAILEAYIKLAQPEYITRLGIRYINSFIFPQENINISDYFNLGINTPPTFAETYGLHLSFLHKLKSVNDKSGPVFNVATKFLTQPLNPDEVGNKFTLDIDCFIQTEGPPLTSHILAIATQAHDTLEEVFESIITDKCRDFMGVTE